MTVFDNVPGATMPNSQQCAIHNDHAWLADKGLMRFEVVAHSADRELIRSLAKTLTEDGPQAQQVRATLAASVAGESSRGNILSALRASPLVGADLDLSRPRELGRTVEL